MADNPVKAGEELLSILERQLLGRVEDGAYVGPEGIEVSVVGVGVGRAVSATGVGTDELYGYYKG